MAHYDTSIQLSETCVYELKEATSPLCETIVSSRHQNNTRIIVEILVVSFHSRYQRVNSRWVIQFDEYIPSIFAENPVLTIFIGTHGPASDH